MRKLFVLALIVFVCFALVACGGNGANVSSGDSNDTSPALDTSAANPNADAANGGSSQPANLVGRWTLVGYESRFEAHDLITILEPDDEFGSDWGNRFTILELNQDGTAIIHRPRVNNSNMRDPRPAQWSILDDGRFRVQQDRDEDNPHSRALIRGEFSLEGNILTIIDYRTTNSETRIYNFQRD